MLRSFQARLAVLIGLIVLGSTLPLALWLGAAIEEDRVESQGRALQEMARNIGVVLGAGMDDRLAQVENLARVDLFPYARSLAEVDNHSLDRIAATRAHYSWIGVADADGRVRAASRGMLVGETVAARPWFQKGLAGIHAGDVHPAKLLAAMLPASADGGPARFIDFAAPLNDASGKVVGVLGAHVNWDWTRDVIASLARDDDMRAGIEVFLLDREGKPILRPKNSTADGPAPALPASGTGLVAGHGQEHLVARAALAAQAPPNQLGWTVVVRQPAELALASARHARQLVSLAGLLVAAVAMVAVWMMAGAFTRPLAELRCAAGEIAAGRVDAELPVPSGAGEIKQLGAALAEMARSLQKRERVWREAHAQMEARLQQLEPHQRMFIQAPPKQPGQQPGQQTIQQIGPQEGQPGAPRESAAAIE